MNRLRVRVELNRRKTGVPLDELVSVVEETRKFFQLLAEDVQIPVERGEWHASNFDPESLNFTAEFTGPASPEQIHAFGSAFGGATSLRRETIAQFTHIADFIGEDELVGFGLYQSDQESEPSDWRCLSRRDALRFADEIRLLANVAGESGPEASLPAVINGSVGGRRLFKDRREREVLAVDPTKWIRDVESSLSRRIGLLETEVEANARRMHSLGNTQEAADERFLKLLGAMESFWSQAHRQLPPTAPEPTAHGAASLGDESALPPAQHSKPRRRRRLVLALTAAGLALAAIGASELISQRPQLSRYFDLRPIVKPSSAASIPPAADPASARLVKSAIAPSGPEGIDSPLQAGQQKAVSLAPTSTPADNSPQIQARGARSESAADSLRHGAGPEMIHQISLEVPPDVQALVREQVLINVTVDIDPRGKVTAAEVASTRGEAAGLLTTEALKAARWFRFRPNRQGNKAVASQTVLTFVFDPGPEVLLPAGVQPGN